ncbi:MAG TPA: FtsX-like permease family protein [Vicinamibacterales bacterium]|nr:FtsX-like permease family protein [Vicinamibacterales bacterium]
MKFLPLVWSGLRRHAVRTACTLLSLVVAFMLLATLMAIRTAFSAGVTVAGAERLMMTAKIPLINPLPLAYGPVIASEPGVRDVSHANWFGGVYQDPSQSFPSLAVDPASWLRVHPEFHVSRAQQAAWLADRTGALVGADTARRFGWTVGDRVPLRGTIYRRPDGRPWEFTIDGIYHASGNADQSQFFLHYDYLDETLPPGAYGKNEVSWYVIRVSDPSQSQQIASRLDARFANSPYETRTATEKAFVSSFAHQIGEIGPIVVAVAGLVLFMILLVAGNTMAQAVRERTSELAVLRTLGFTGGHLAGLVLAESCAIAAIGGGTGLALSWIAITVIGDPTHGLLPPLRLTPVILLTGAAVVVTLGVMTALVPVLQVRRIRIVEALRRS